MSFSRTVLGLSGLVLAIAACSSAPASTTTPAGGTLSPTTAATTAAAATPASTPGITAGPTGAPPAGEICAAFPTVDPANPLNFPSFAPDPTLESHFPSTIDGAPVTDVSSGSWAQFACLFGSSGSTAIQQLQTNAQYNLLSLTFGSANATVDGDDIEMFAFRLPGGDANTIVATLAQLSAAAGGNSDIKSVGTGTAGGKTVIVVNNNDGTTGYGYVSGDTLITVDDITQSQADKIFAVIQ